MRAKNIQVPIPNTDLLTVEETAFFLRLRQSTIRSWVLQRKIAFIKLGRSVRFRRSDLEAMLNSAVIPVEEKQ